MAKAAFEPPNGTTSSPTITTLEPQDGIPTGNSSSSPTPWRTPSPHGIVSGTLSKRNATPQSPGISNLWKPASVNIVTPRRVLYSNSRSYSNSNSPTQRDQQRSPLNRMMKSRRAKFMILFGSMLSLACSVHVYMACFLLQKEFPKDPKPTPPQQQHVQLLRKEPKGHDPPSDYRRYNKHRPKKAPKVPSTDEQTIVATKPNNYPRVVLLLLSNDGTVVTSPISHLLLNHHPKSENITFELPEAGGRVEGEKKDADSTTATTIPTNVTSSSASVNNATANSANTNTSRSEDNNEDKGGYHIEEDGTGSCQPLAAWQTQNPVNCNSIHEIDMLPSHTNLEFLGQGWFRSTWKLDPMNVVLKTLRLEREFLDEYYELHRRDAVAMEQMTFSPFVMDVYGYCGQSALNELAAFKEGVNSLEQLNRRMRGKHGDAVLLLKLRLALSVAVGLYHVQYGGPGLPWDEPPERNVTTTLSSSNSRLLLPAIAHYDINPRNIAIVAGGTPKLNDFNIAEFLQYKPGQNETCGFQSRLHEPWWRAPEEMDMSRTITLVDEKVDVYALGNVLYHILTTHSPRGKMKKERMESVRDVVRQGIAPKLDDPWANSKDPIIVTFRKAMKLCFHADPKQRGTSREVATVLYEAIQKKREKAKTKGK